MIYLNILAIGMGWPNEQPGGLNTYLKSMCYELSQDNNINIIPLVLAEQEIQDSKVNVVKVGSRSSSLKKRQLLFKKKFIELLDTTNIDILNVHFAPNGINAMIEAKKRGIPIVMNFHGPWAKEIAAEVTGIKNFLKVFYAREIEKKAYNLADYFIVLSVAFKNILITDFGIDEKKIYVIPGAADIGRFKVIDSKNSVRNKLKIPQNKRVVLTVRRLVRRMGLIELVNAWVKVVKENPNALLLIGGKGPLEKELVEIININGLQENIKLLGFISDDELPLYYRSADLFVVPTQVLEGFGLITTEAMACGTPVMATPVGGNKEILEKFNNDLLFSDNTSEAISNGINQILKNIDNLPSSEECREHILKYYTWDIVGEKIKKLIHLIKA